MTELSFRPATHADLPQLIALLADDALGKSREDLSTPINLRYVRAFEAILADSNQYQLVAERMNRIVGCLQITMIPGLSRLGTWRGQLESIRVARKERGGGVGKRMLRFAIEECRARGCGIVQLTTDKSRLDAHRFYNSLGFTATHEGMKLFLVDAS